jgi:two-component system, NtrC family, response regulator AtoC
MFDITVIDMNMPEMDGMELLGHIKRISPNTECIMVTAVNEAKIAVECLKKGAYNYLVKPVANEDLVFSIKRALERKRLLDILDLEKKKTLPKLSNPKPFKSIVTRSKNLLRILKEAELHAASDVPVLITGESGTGKELLARAIHGASPRAKGTFTAVNMASVAATLFDAEFFGHAKGAFTGAEKDRTGYLEHTYRGTLFLDEIGNLPIELQGKLLRVLQDGEYMKIGTNAHQTADVRFIAATNEDLDKMIARKRFRKDLYYRIRGGWLHLPPLRERREDIPLLIVAFLKEISHPTGKSGTKILNEDAMAVLMNYHYPGNVRELRSIVHSAVNLAQGRSISVNFLPEQVKKHSLPARDHDPSRNGPILPLSDVEKSHILKAYEHTGRNKSKTARLLGIGLNTLRRKLESYGVP